MFKKRAEKNKKTGDQYYAQAMSFKSDGDKNKYQVYMNKAQAQYKMQKDNEKSAKQHAGKSW